MPLKRFLFWALVFFLLSLPLPTAAEVPFKPGEKLTFLLRWEFVPAGEAVMTVEPMTKIQGEPSYHFIMTAKSNSFLDLFYKVRDRIESYTDVGMNHSLFYKKKQREGRTKRNTIVTFDWKNNKAQYVDNKKKRVSVELLSGAFDPLGIFYYVRSLDFEGVSNIERPVSDGKKCVIGIGHIVKRETITVPAGTYDTFLIEPDLKDVGGVFEKSEDANIHIWVTADRYHIPVKIQSKVAVGRFMGELTEAYIPE
jgi:hypothetical protein